MQVIQVVGPELDLLRGIALKVAAALQEADGVEQVSSVGLDVGPAYSPTVSREKAAMFGVSQTDVEQALRAMASDWKIGPVRVRLGGKMEDLLLTSRSGSSVPLKEIAEIELREEFLEIRSRQERYMIVTFGGDDLNLKEVQEQVGNSVTLLPGYELRWE